MSKKKVIHYYNDIVLPGTYHNATKLARINLANAFAEINYVEKVNFYFITNSKKNLKKLGKKFNKKVELRPIVIPWIGDLSFSDNNLTLKDKLNEFYRILVANRIVSFCFFILLFKSSLKKDILFLRGDKVLSACFFVGLFRRIEFGFELHNFEFGINKLKDFIYFRLMKKAKCLISITKYTKNKWIEMGIGNEKIFVLPSGVNMEIFDKIKENKGELRKKLKLDKDKKIVTYLGGLYENRGIEEIIYSANKNSDIQFLIIGGTAEEVKFYRNYIKKQNFDVPNVLFLGFVEQSRASLFLKASDVLLAPYSKKVSTVDHMSPIKIFEYLAAGVPTIVSNLPRIREIIPAESVVFFEADNSNDLNKKIRNIFDNYDFYFKKSKKTQLYAREFSWLKRAEKIINKML